MQLLKGEDLNKYMSHKQVSIDDSVSLANTLLNMSQFLLKSDLVHGDIKPQNLMISKNDYQDLEFKIIDFGSMTEIFSNDTRAGTPSYLSPERFQGEAISESSVILRSISIDKEQRYTHYSEMNFELKYPQKVKPFFTKNSSYIQREPLTFYRVGFVAMSMLNIILLLWLGYIS